MTAEHYAHNPAQAITDAPHFQAAAEQRERYLVALVKAVGKDAARHYMALQGTFEDQQAFSQWLESRTDIYW